MFKQIRHRLTFISEKIGSIPFEISFITKDYWGLLFIGCLSLYQPKFLFLAMVYIAFRINKRIVLKHKKEAPNILDHCILCIHMNHLQSLTEAIESNPDLLYCEYKKKSLLHWCKFYNNTKALMVIIQMTQKYPKKELLAS